MALRMHLYSWKAIVHRTEEYPLRRTRFISDLNKYRDIYHSLGRFKISDSSFENLLKRGDPGFPCEGEVRDTFSFESFSCNDSLTWLWQARELMAPRKECLPLTSFAKPGQEFILNFLPYYKIAKEGGQKEKQSLMRLLTVCKDRSPSISFLCQLLVFALTKQEAPSFDEIHTLFFQTMEEKEFYTQCTMLHTKALKEAISNKTYDIRHWCQGLKGWAIVSAVKTIQKTPLAPPDLDPLKPYPFPARLILMAQMHCEMPNLDHSIMADLIEGPQNIQEAACQVLSWATTCSKKAEADQNPLAQAEFDRLKEGAEEFLQECQEATQNGLTSKVPALSSDGDAIQEVVSAYTNEIKQLKSELLSLKQTILTTANDTHHNKKCTLEFMRDLRTPFDIETLLIALGREDFVSIQAVNPTLTQAGIERLMQKVADYAILLSHINQLKRCRLSLAQYKTLVLANPNDPALRIKADEYFTHRREKRVFKPYENPRLLVFEALGDLLIRTEQYEATLSLTDVHEVWKLIEARTGFGKSKVLLPLWLILSAQPDALAMMVSPANIFDGQENFLQKKMYAAYRFFCVRLHFSRDSECTPEEINYLLTTLQEAQSLRRPVFMSDQTAHNLLVLKVKEIAQLAVRSGQHETLSALLELRCYIKKQAVLFVDEPHKVLDDSQESNYSLGSPEGFDKHRLLFSWHIYSALFTVLEGRYRIECWQPPKKGKLPLLNEKTYRKEIVEQLIDALIQQEHVCVTDDKTRGYLLGVMGIDEQSAFEKSLQGKEGAKIRILHDQVHHYLPQTIQQHVNEHYGCLDAEADRIAVPLEDALNPIKDNEFSAADQILNFTIQANLGTPFSQDYIVHFLLELTEQASQEMEEGAETIRHTRAYAKFISIVQTMGSQAPANLLKIQSTEIERIGAHLEENVQAKLRFITLSVLPQLRRYSQKIVSTPHLLFPCFKKVVGASGTLAMNNLPHQLQVQTDKKAIVKTIISLCRKYQEAGFPHVMDFSIQNSRQIFFNVRHAMLTSGLPLPNVMIEIGAIMRLFPSFSAALQDLLAVFPEFEGVATFDEQGAIVVIKKGSKRQVPYSLAGVKDEKLFWLYPQKDITGTDVKLPPLSQAIIPINRHNTLTELVQGSGRLREIHTGQAGWFGVDPDTGIAINKILGKKVAEPLSLFDLLTYCVLKEAELKGPANVRSLQLQWDALLENAFWDFALGIPVKEVVAAFSILQKSLLVQTTPDAPLERPMMCLKPVDIQVALGILKSTFDHKLKLIGTTLKSSTKELQSKFTPETFEVDVKKIQAAMPYPKRVLLNDDSQATQVAQAASNVNVVASADLLLNVEAQGQGEQVAESQTESNQLWTSWVMNAVSSRTPLPHLPGITSHPVKEVFSHPRLKVHQSLFEVQTPLRLTENSYRTFEGDTLQHPGWVNGYMKPLHYLWIEYTGDTIDCCVLCDVEDAAYLIQDSRPGTLWLVNQGVYLSREGKSSADLLQDKIFRKYELQAKLLNGDLDLNPQQLADFGAIYGEKKEQVRAFVESILAPLHPLLTRSSAYNGLLG